MSDIVTPDDLAVYLGIDTGQIDEDRAQMLVDDAIAQALSVVTVGTISDSGPTEANLPSGAAGVIRAAVARVYLNPRGVDGETVGVVSYTSRGGGTGSMFSKAEIAALRRFAGRGGAFSISMIPADVRIENLPWWDQAPVYEDES